VDFVWMSFRGGAQHRTRNPGGSEFFTGPILDSGFALARAPK
jgi:hypothetical protein